MSPETERNLERAMALEAFANAKYTRFAACARMNENPDLASLFQTTADLDRIAHFRKEFDFVYAPCGDAENLQSAISDKDSVIEMYSEFMRQAEAAARKHGVNFPTLNAAFSDLTSYFHGDFDAVIALGNGLCNLQRMEDIEMALRSMHACCRRGGICVVGIKDFEAIKRNGERFHGHRIVDRDGIRTILFEVWDFEDPMLISTAYVVSHPQDDQPASVRRAQTREYMLCESDLRRLAVTVGFARVLRLDHPNEAAYALRK